MRRTERMMKIEARSVVPGSAPVRVFDIAFAMPPERKRGRKTKNRAEQRIRIRLTIGQFVMAEKREQLTQNRHRDPAYRQKRKKDSVQVSCRERER